MSARSAGPDDDAQRQRSTVAHPRGSIVAQWLRLGRSMVAQARQLRLQQTAGSLAFLSLLAIVPMFSIAFAVTTASPAFARLREALQKFLVANLFPAAISDTVLGHLNQFAARAGELSLIGAVAFLLTAFVALVTIERTLDRIWGAERQRPLALRITLYWLLLTLGPLLLGAYLAAHGSVARAWLRGADMRELRSVWFVLLPWITTVGGMTLLYRLLPNAPVRWREAFAGALAAAVLIEALRGLFGWYVARLPTYTVVYGAFSALPVFLLWLFLAWEALLAGALLAANLRFWGRPGEPHRARAPAERFDDAWTALAAMSARLGGRRDAALPVADLAPQLGGDAQRAREIAQRLARLGYVSRFAPFGSARGDDAQRGEAPGRGAASRWRRRDPDPVWDERWSWASDPRALTARRLFDDVWCDGAAASGQWRFEAAFLDQPLAGDSGAG